MSAPPAPVREPAWQLSRSSIGLWVTQGVIGAVGVGIAATIFTVSVPTSAGGPVPLLRWVVPIAAVLFAVVVVGVRPWFRYRVHRWEVTDTAVYTQTGWWARERRIAPMSRIQTVDHAEGAVSRLFGLSTVTVTTASAAGALEIAGLDRLRALALVDELTIKADTVPGDAT
jgi:membrane protein YdbS with pleckstrin-like domain